MSNEFGRTEVNETCNASVENYKNIKPESDMSTKDASDFWSDVINNQSNNAETSDNTFSNEMPQVESTVTNDYLDDNGISYREGDRLLPNTQFEVNGYQYETDSQGRVISAEGQLRMRDQDYKRDMEDVRSIDGQEYQKDDHRGHIIGHQFGGSDKLENLVPMQGELNQGDYAKLEKTLADAVQSGAETKMKVEPVYQGESTRPSEFRVTYSINNEQDVVVFKNESGAKK